MKNAYTRRRILLTGAIASSAALLSRSISAAEMKLPIDDPAAQALGYVENAEVVDSAVWTKYEPGQHCGNCMLYQGEADTDWGPCSIFPGKQVAKAGWCSAYVVKPS